jgi:hypothetical protein
MSVLIRWTLLAAVLISLSGCERQPDFEVAEGYVLEAETNRPIEGAFVLLYWSAKKKPASWIEAEVVVKTDASGRFTHKAPRFQAFGWRDFIVAYKPGLEMYPFWEYDDKSLLMAVEKLDENGIERSHSEMRALGFEVEPVNKPTLSGWVKRIKIPKWYRRSGTRGPMTIYMQRADSELNDRLRRIERTSQSLNSVNQRIGPFREYDTARLTEATQILCAGNTPIDFYALHSFTNIYADWHLRVRGRRKVWLPVPSGMESEAEALRVLRNANYGLAGARKKIVTPELYRHLCVSSQAELANENPK